MSILSAIGSLFSPITKLVETLDISGNKKQELLNMLHETAQKSQLAVMDFMKAELYSADKVVSRWRPICSMALVGGLIVGDVFNVEMKNTVDLAKIFLSVYGAGRTGEKITSFIVGKK